jgi:hypothetical protein
MRVQNDKNGQCGKERQMETATLGAFHEKQICCEKNVRQARGKARNLLFDGETFTAAFSDRLEGGTL